MLLMTFAGSACNRSASDGEATSESAPDMSGSTVVGKQRRAVLAGGCFWCTEAVFEQLEGVLDVVSGYAGGSADSANYRAVAAGQTDHAEAIQITYDPTKITFEKLLKVFFTVAHDPTQLNQQGPDTGRQYRSAVFCTDAQEKKVAEDYIRQLEDTKLYAKPIVTTLEMLKQFYPAETYHQDYVQQNPNQPYVVANALPKVKKVRETFANQLAP